MAADGRRAACGCRAFTSWEAGAGGDCRAFWWQVEMSPDHAAVPTSPDADDDVEVLVESPGATACDPYTERHAIRLFPPAPTLMA